MLITLTNNFGDRTWWTKTGTLFAKQLMKKVSGRSKKKEVRVKRAKAFWAMTAAKDRSEDFFDPACKDHILGRNQTRQELRREHLKDPAEEALDKALKFLENQYFKRIVGSRFFVKLAVDGLWPRGHGAKDVGYTDVGRCLEFVWIRGTACVCAQSPRIGTSQGSIVPSSVCT